MNHPVLALVVALRVVAGIELKTDLYEKIQSSALSEAEQIVASVDTKCIFRLRDASRLRFVLQPTQGGNYPRLCRVVLGNESTIVLTMVNSLEYLTREGNWQSFLNKVSYCQKSQRSFYIWIGELVPSILHKRHRIPWLDYAEASSLNTINIYKTIALLALLKEHSGHNVLYLDADAWFSDIAFDLYIRPEDYIDLSDQAFLYGNQNRVGGNKILMNGGLLFVKNNKAARNFLALWFYSRSGKKDQLPLWATLLALWTIRSGGGFLDESIFQSYTHSARIHTLPKLIADLPKLRKPILDHDAHNPYNGGQFATTFILDQPLELPGVLLLPSASIDLRDRSHFDAAPRHRIHSSIPAIRSDLNLSAPTFCCHTRFKKTENLGQCQGSNVCRREKCAPYLVQTDSSPPASLALDDKARSK